MSPLPVGAVAHEAAIQLEIREQKQLAAVTFSSAAPFLNGVLADISRVQRSLRQAESFIQLSAKPKKTNMLKPAGKSVAKKVGGKDVADAAAAALQLGKVGSGQLSQMLGLMQGMYANWKGKISDSNRKEQEEKRKYESEVKGLEQKKMRFKNDANATKTYDYIEKYWKKQRALSHRQYHTALKLMHSGMQKFKTMIGAYKEALAGQKPSAKTLKAVEMPDVVLVMLKTETKRLAKWAKDASAILRDARNPHPGMKYS